jgi:hypothetical protein
MRQTAEIPQVNDNLSEPTGVISTSCPQANPPVDEDPVTSKEVLHALLLKRVLNENEEIRQLRNKLENVRTQRDRISQVCDLKLRLDESRKLEAAYDQLILDKEREEIAADKERSKMMAIEREEARRTQQEQIRLKRAHEEKLKNEAVGDRKNLINRIEQENIIAARQEADRELKVKTIRAELLEFMSQRRKSLADAKLHEKLENEKNREYMESVVRREEERLRVRREQEAEKQRIWQKVANEVSQKSAKEVDMESLINDLHFEQADEAIRQRMIDDATARKNHQLELLYQYQKQLSEKHTRSMESKFEEEKIRKELLAEFHERAQYDITSKQKRKEKMLAFQRDLDSLIESKRQMFAAAQAQELEAGKRTIESSNLELQIIEEEKQRILAEYSAVLAQLT